MLRSKVIRFGVGYHSPSVCCCIHNNRYAIKAFKFASSGIQLHYRLRKEPWFTKESMHVRCWNLWRISVSLLKCPLRRNCCAFGSYTFESHCMQMPFANNCHLKLNDYSNPLGCVADMKAVFLLALILLATPTVALSRAAVRTFLISGTLPLGSFTGC